MLAWGFSYLIYFLAFFSLNLAIFNLIPILPFDGGHFVLYAVELVSRRSINRKVQQVMMQVGFIILIALMVFILFVDIFNIFS
jgi:regulator of sigma E protease